MAAAHSAVLRGASELCVVDRQRDPQGGRQPGLLFDKEVHALQRGVREVRLSGLTVGVEQAVRVLVV